MILEPEALDLDPDLNVKSVSEKTSRFKVLVSDTFKVFYAIFPILKYKIYVFIFAAF